MDYKVLYEKKEYNLNAVLSFDLLKEVLYKLLISQGNLEKEIDNIKKSNTKRDNDISKLQKIIKDNLAYDDDDSGELNNSYFSQQENDEEEENENNHENEEENIPTNNEQKQEETKEEKTVVNNENEEEKKEEIKEVKETKEIKPQPEIFKGEEIKYNGENKETEIKEIKNEKEKEVIVKDNQEVNTENKQDEKNEEKENVVEEKKEEKKEDIDNKINTENIKESKQEEFKKIEPKKPEAKTNKRENKVHVSKRPKKPIQKEQIEVPSYQNDDNNNNTDRSNATHIPTELISKMAKQIKDNKKQILDLEKRFKKELVLKTENLKQENKQILNKNNKENQLKFAELNDKFNQMMELKEKLENQMEDCVTKCSTIDVFNMFKDSGDGTVDAAKVMVRALEEKVFKKIEYIDARAKKDQNNNSVMKNNLEDFYKVADNMKKEIQNLNENFEKNKEDINNIKNDFDDYKNEVNDFITNNSDLKKEIEKIKNREKNIKDSINEIKEKIKNLESKNNNLDEGSNDLLKLGFGNKGVDEEVIQTLERKIGDLRKKMNDLENTLKLKIQDLEEIQYESKNLKTILDKKITRDDLKELYNLHLSDLDEINDIKDNINVTFDDIRKIKEQQTNIFQKLENINRNIALLQNIKKDGSIKPGVINFDKYVEQDKLTDTIKPILTSLDKIFKELGSLGRSQSELESYTKTLPKTERVNKLEDDLLAKISELKVIFGKKYVEKSE